MSYDKNEEYINWELIYKPFQTLQKILLGKNEQINIFEMIYKPKEKKLEKKEKIKNLKLILDMFLMMIKNILKMY